MEIQKTKSYPRKSRVRKNHRRTLKGTVLFAEKYVRSFEGESYTALKITVDGGEERYELRLDDRKMPLPDVRVFDECKIRVTRRKRGADSTLIKGTFSQS